MSERWIVRKGDLSVGALCLVLGLQLWARRRLLLLRSSLCWEEVENMIPQPGAAMTTTSYARQC